MKKILFLFIILISGNVKSQNFNGGLIGGFLLLKYQVTTYPDTISGIILRFI